MLIIFLQTPLAYNTTIHQTALTLQHPPVTKINQLIFYFLTLPQGKIPLENPRAS